MADQFSDDTFQLAQELEDALGVKTTAEALHAKLTSAQVEEGYRALAAKYGVEVRPEALPFVSTPLELVTMLRSDYRVQKMIAESLSST